MSNMFANYRIDRLFDRRCVIDLLFELLLLCIVSVQSFKYYLPSLKNFEFCSNPFRVSIYTVKQFNNLTGLSVYFKDNIENALYRVDIDEMGRNGLPKFHSAEYELLHRTKIFEDINYSLEIMRLDSTGNYIKTELFFKEYFYFFKSLDKEFSYLGGYSSDLIGCPQVLCLNAYFDAAFCHEEENRHYFFRGDFYYSFPVNNRSTYRYQFDLIQKKFWFVPMNVDAATYFETKFYTTGYVIIFVKDTSVFLYSGNRRTAREMNIHTIFRPNTMPQSVGYINTLTNLGTSILVSRDNAFTLYLPFVDPMQKNEISFLADGLDFINIPSNKSLHIERADDSITVRKTNTVFFIIKFKFYFLNLNTLQKLIRHRDRSINQIAVETSHDELFFDYFSCPKSYYQQLRVNKEEFDRIYLRILPDYHQEDAWRKLITSLEPYDPTLIYITIGIVQAFLIVAYILFFIFVSTYLQSVRKLEEITRLTRSSYKVEDSGFPSAQYSTAATRDKKSSIAEKRKKTKKTDRTYDSDQSVARKSMFNKFFRANRATKDPSESISPLDKPVSKLISKSEYKVIKIDNHVKPPVIKLRSLARTSDTETTDPTFSDYNPLQSKLTVENLKNKLMNKSVSYKQKKSQKKFLM